MDYPPGRMRSRWTDEDGLRMHTRVSIELADPTLTPVVCVHGLSVSSRYMVPIARRIAPYRYVYAPDLPGFGKSAAPATVLDIPELADALLRRMDAFGIGKAALIGNSMGCQIIADLALRYPARVESMVMIGPTMDREGRTPLEQAWRLFQTAFHEPLTSIVTQSYDYWLCGLHRTISTLHYALADRIEVKLPQITVPTLLVRGTNDIVVPQRWLNELAALLHHGGEAVIPDAPHALNYDTPDQLAHIVLPFLERTSVTAAKAL